VIGLKSKLLTTLTIVLITSIVLASYASFTSAAAQKQGHQKPDAPQKQYSSFALTASGTAKNAAGEHVVVSLSIDGSVNGKSKTVIHLHTQSGDASVEGYDSIAAIRGQGIVVNKNHFVHLVIMMSSDAYGGRNTLWVLRGTTQSLTESNTMPISLEAPKVMLPTDGYPQLTDLTLAGTINFN
jgi:hypothetical protein